MKRHIIYSLVAVGAAIIGGATLGSGDVSAADMTVSNASQIAGAIAQAGLGDTITFNAGTYNLTDFINLYDKEDVTLRGNGTVILQYDGASATTPNIQEAIHVLDSNAIWLENLTIQATSPSHEAAFTTASTGVGINSSCQINLQNVTIRNFGRSAVTVTRLQDTGAHDCVAGDITFDNFTSNGSKTGILFTNGAGAPAGDIRDVKFTGTTTITGADYGIMMDANSNLSAIRGVDGGRVNFGTVNITTNEINGMLYPIRIGTSPAIISLDSTINGVNIRQINYKVFCDLVGAYIIPDGVCVNGAPQMVGFNCACDPNDPNNPDVPCLMPEECEECEEPGDSTVTVPNTGFVSGTMELIKSNAVLLAGVGVGALVGAVLVAGWIKKLHRIKL